MEKCLSDYGIRFVFSDFIENKLFCISFKKFAGLYEMNLDNDEIKCLGELPIEYQCVFNHPTEYVVLKHIRNEIIIAPYMSDGDLIIYNLDTGVFKKIKLAQKVFNKKTCGEVISNVFSFGDSLYFVANHVGIIVEYDSASKIITYHEDWFDNVASEIGIASIATTLQGIEQSKNYVYMAIRDENKILRIDPATHSVEMFSMPYEFHAYGIRYDGNFFWISSIYGESVTKWDPIEMTFQRNFLPTSLNPAYQAVGISDQYVFLFPCLESRFFAIDRRDNALVQIKILEDMLKKMEHNPNPNEYPGKYIAVLSHNGKIYALMNDTRLQEIDICTGKVNLHTQKLNRLHDEDIRIRSNIWRGKMIYTEEPGLGLSVFLKNILNANEFQNIGRKTDIGERILKEAIRG